MLPNMHERFPEFYIEHKAEIGRHTKDREAIPNDSALRELQTATMKSFGNEWEKWDAFGWGDSVTMEQTRRIFAYKVMAGKEELDESLVVDAGCGNGRYTKVALDLGAEVIGIDLSAADVAYENLKDDPKAHIIQGDLFHPPLKKSQCDFIFSNGVLMHTGNAKKAFLALVPLLKDTGAITIHLYHKGNLLYEFNDRWSRAITTRLPLPFMHRFSEIVARVAKALPSKFVQYGLNVFFRVEAHPHYVFDWYTAPIATHHTYPEVYGWLKEAGLHLVKDHNITRHPWRKWILPFFFLTVKAQRKPLVGAPIHTID